MALDSKSPRDHSSRLNSSMHVECCSVEFALDICITNIQQQLADCTIRDSAKLIHPPISSRSYVNA